VQRIGLRHVTHPAWTTSEIDRARPWPADHLTLIKKDKKEKNYPVMLDWIIATDASHAVVRQ